MELSEEIHTIINKVIAIDGYVKKIEREGLEDKSLEEIKKAVNLALESATKIRSSIS